MVALKPYIPTPCGLKLSDSHHVVLFAGCSLCRRRCSTYQPLCGTDHGKSGHISKYMPWSRHNSAPASTSWLHADRLLHFGRLQHCLCKTHRLSHLSYFHEESCIQECKMQTYQGRIASTNIPAPQVAITRQAHGACRIGIRRRRAAALSRTRTQACSVCGASTSTSRLTTTTQL